MPTDPYDLIIRGGTVVSGGGRERADVAIQGRTIAVVGPRIRGSAHNEIDATGQLILPGVVDEHVHPVYLDDPIHVSRVALYGGVTTLMHFAYAFPGESLVASVAALRERARGSLVDYTVHAGMFDAAVQVDEVPAVATTGVRTFKVFLAYAAQGWMTDDRSLVRVLRAVRDAQGLLLVHCENGAAIDVLEDDARRGLLGDDLVNVVGRTRPPVLEAEAVSRTLMLAEAFEAPVFIVHVTSARALEAVVDAQRRGRWVVAETCPQYLTLTQEALREWGALAKIGPPLRTADDVEALWAGLRDGHLQTIGSDHVPKKTIADRDEPLLDAAFGAPGLETMLSVCFDEGVARGRITLERLVQLLSENPARIFGLWPRKGRVAAGADADVVVWDPEARRVLGQRCEHSRAGYSLFEGRQVTGTPRAVIVGGQLAVRDGELLEISAAGRFQPTGPFDLTVGRHSVNNDQEEPRA